MPRRRLAAGVRYSARPAAAPQPAPAAVGGPSPASTHARLLVVDPDPSGRNEYRRLGDACGLPVHVVRDGRGAIKQLQREGTTVVVVALDAGVVDGLDACGRIRATSPVPIIARLPAGPAELVEEALAAGASDVTFARAPVSEFRTRIAVALAGWRTQAPKAVASLRAGDLVLNPDSRSAQIAGRPVDLTPTEYDLLHVLAAARGRVVGHAELLRRVWGPAATGDTSLLWVKVCHLRRKLGALGAGQILRTVPRVGYVLAVPPRPR